MKGTKVLNPRRHYDGVGEVRAYSSITSMSSACVVMDSVRMCISHRKMAARILAVQGRKGSSFGTEQF